MKTQQDQQAWEEARKIIEDLAAYHKNYPPGMYSPGSPAHTVNIEIEERAVAWVERLAALQRSKFHCEQDEAGIARCPEQCEHCKEATEQEKPFDTPILHEPISNFFETTPPSQEEKFPYPMSHTGPGYRQWHEEKCKDIDKQRKEYIAARKHSAAEQKWISVEEKPKDDREVLIGLWRQDSEWDVLDEDERASSTPGFFDHSDGKWKFHYGAKNYEYNQSEVICWMDLPLPSPPLSKDSKTDV
jgi:hypothetical protein